VDECPVNRRWPRGVVRDEGELLEPQLSDDGFQVTDLIVSLAACRCRGKFDRGGN